MKNITLALAIALGFCATEAGAQAMTRQRRGLLGGRQPRNSLDSRREYLELQKQQREYEDLTTGGKLQQLEQEVIESRVAYEKVSALEEKSKTLSADALAIYKDRLKVLKSKCEVCSNRLAQAQAMLTPEKINEFRKLTEMEKAEIAERTRKQKAKAEYLEFVAGADNEIAGELWSDWPEDVFCLNPHIVQKCEEKFKVVFGKEDNDEWIRGCGKCLIEERRESWRRSERAVLFWKKFDSDGILIQAGRYENFKEYAWMTNCAAYVTIELRKKWAEAHGMSYEEAVRKIEARKEKVNPNPPLKTRSAKYIEREEQREKQIVEALRKVCEAER